MELVKGHQIKLSIDPSVEQSGNASVVYVDYKNIVKVLSVGSRVFIDDGLISLNVDAIGQLFSSAG